LRFKSGQHVTFKIQDPARPAHLTQQNCSPIAAFVLSVSHSVTNRVRTPTNFSIALPCLSHASGPCSNFSHPKDGSSSRPRNWVYCDIFSFFSVPSPPRKYGHCHGHMSNDSGRKWSESTERDRGSFLPVQWFACCYE
jgi:hypothetical protein